MKTYVYVDGFNPQRRICRVLASQATFYKTIVINDPGNAIPIWHDTD